MGGNAYAVDILNSTKDNKAIIAYPDKIVFNKYFVTPQKLIEDVQQLMSQLNILFESLYHKQLWDDDVIRKHLIYAGNYNNLILYPDYFPKYYIDLGDIDVFCPKNNGQDIYIENMHKFWDMLYLLQYNVENDMEIKHVLSKTNFKYLGQTFLSSSNVRSQIYTVFRYNDQINIQIDFNFVPFTDSENNNNHYIPQSFFQFSYGNNFKDVLQLKPIFPDLKTGVAHKIVLYALIKTLYKFTEPYCVATPASTPEKIKISTAKGLENLSIYSFSVERGMRWKYAYMKDSNNQPIYANNKIVLQAVDTSKITYWGLKEIQHVPTIFKMLKNKKTQNCDYDFNIDDFYSYQGLVEFIVFHYSMDIIQAVENKLNEIFFEKETIILQYTNAEQDWLYKSAIVQSFKYLVQQNLDKLNKTNPKPVI